MAQLRRARRPRYRGRVVTGLAAVTITALAACSGGEGGTQNPQGAAGNGGSGNGPCDGKIDGPVKLTVSTHVRDDKTVPVNPITVYREQVDRFNATVGKEKGITVSFANFGEAAYEKGLQSAIQRGDAPDVAEVDAPFAGSFAYTGILQSLGNCVPKSKLASLLPSVVANGQVKGKQYLLGSYESGMGMWASKKALAKAGARIPTSAADAWTAEEFDALLGKLKAAGYPTPLNIEWSYPAGEWRAFGFGPALVSAGGGLLNPDFTKATGTINSDASVQAMTWFQKWANAGIIDRSTATGVNDTNFVKGKSAISWVGHWMGGAYSKALGDDLVLVPLPNFGQGSKVYTGSWAFGMTAKAKDPDAAYAFIDFMTSSEASKALAASESAIPADKTVFEADPAYQEGGLQHLYALNLTATGVPVPRPQTPAYLVARDAFSTAFGDIINGADVTVSLDRAAEKIDADLAANDGYQP
ncbi:MAG: sugar ABC transporter substrate-binding protein [Angustibacter sp.]